MQSRSPEAQISGGEALFQRVEPLRQGYGEPGDNAFHRCARKSGFNVVTKCWQNIPRQLCGFALRKTARVAIRDSKFGICKSPAGSTLHTSCFTTSIHSMKSSTVSAASLFLGLTWILSLTSVSGQTLAPIHKLPLNEPLEKYNDATGATSKNRDFAADDLAVRSVRQLPGECRCEWQQHPRRCCKRALYFC